MMECEPQNTTTRTSADDNITNVADGQLMSSIKLTSPLSSTIQFYFLAILRKYLHSID